MNRKSRACARRKFVLIALSLLTPVSIATAADYGDANPFERSTLNDEWGILDSDIFFGGADALFGLSPASRTLLFYATTELKTASDSNAIVNAANASKAFFSFGPFLSSPFGVRRRGGSGTAPNAVTAAKLWDGGTSGGGLSWTATSGVNWSPNGVPVSGDTLTLDNSIVNIPTTMQIGTNLGALSVTFANSFNPTKTTTIGSNAGTSPIFTFDLGWSLTNNATSGLVTFNPTVSGGSSPLSFALNGAGTVTVASGGTIAWNTVIADGPNVGSIAKAGTGTLVLGAANTYTGGTSVTAGTLRVSNTTGSGTGTSSVTVTNAGTTLTGGTTTGVGGISGPVNINPSATLSPGTSGTGAGTTAILNTGALTLVSASNFNVDLNSLTAGTGYDQLDVTGTVNVSGSNLGITVGGAFALGDKFFITLNDGTDLVTGTFAQVGTVTANNGYTFLINYLDNGDGGLVGNDISLMLTAIPEPSTWVGAALALAAIGLTQRRRLRGPSARGA